MILDDIKTLKHISDSSQDELLSIYIRRAETAIGKYLNSDLDNTTIEAKYPDAVIEYVVEALNRQGDEGVRQGIMSSVQATYELGLSEEVKALLPLPFIRMMG